MATPFSINDFITNALKKGGARPTLFKVTLDSPIGNTLGSLSSFHVHSASIPASTITPFEIPYMGRKIKLAGDRTFDDWTVSIYNDEDFSIRKNLEEWHNRINSLEGNMNTFASSAPVNYRRTAIVTQYSKHGEALRSYKFWNMFPATIGPIELDWNSTDTIEMFQVNFVYDYYEIIDGKAEPGGIGSGTATGSNLA